MVGVIAMTSIASAVGCDESGDFDATPPPAPGLDEFLNSDLPKDNRPQDPKLEQESSDGSDLRTQNEKSDTENRVRFLEADRGRTHTQIEDSIAENDRLPSLLEGIREENRQLKASSRLPRSSVAPAMQHDPARIDELTEQLDACQEQSDRLRALNHDLVAETRDLSDRFDDLKEASRSHVGAAKAKPVIGNDGGDPAGQVRTRGRLVILEEHESCRLANDLTVELLDDSDSGGVQVRLGPMEMVLAPGYTITATTPNGNSGSIRCEARDLENDSAKLWIGE
jgi:hypothetical protein